MHKAATRILWPGNPGIAKRCGWESVKKLKDVGSWIVPCGQPWRAWRVTSIKTRIDMCHLAKAVCRCLANVVRGGW
jgi:hypothetical protein